MSRQPPTERDAKCALCGGELPPPPYFRRDSCRCGADIHACVQCSLYAPGSYNDCRESETERVADKERGNACEWFCLSGSGPDAKKKDAALSALDKLFKK
ncbi:hypothetical protein EPN96_11660 [bacterium]|nr:MAG: hypothetical protein EPN96_11660 [bacterium]